MRYTLVEGYLKLADVSVDEICEELDITRRTFNNKINGFSDFTLKEAKYISSKVGRPIDEIFLIKDVS